MSGPQAKSRPVSSELMREGADPAGDPVAAAHVGEPVMGAGTGSSTDDAGAHEASAEEREVLEAIQHYQRTSKRMFPTWSEVLEIMQQLGYRKSD